MTPIPTKSEVVTEEPLKLITDFASSTFNSDILLLTNLWTLLCCNDSKRNSCYALPTPSRCGTYSPHLLIAPFLTWQSSVTLNLSFSFMITQISNQLHIFQLAQIKANYQSPYIYRVTRATILWYIFSPTPRTNCVVILHLLLLQKQSCNCISF